MTRRSMSRMTLTLPRPRYRARLCNSLCLRHDLAIRHAQLPGGVISWGLREHMAICISSYLAQCPTKRKPAEAGCSCSPSIPLSPARPGSLLGYLASLLRREHRRTPCAASQAPLSPRDGIDARCRRNGLAGSLLNHGERYLVDVTFRHPRSVAWDSR